MSLFKNLKTKIREKIENIFSKEILFECPLQFDHNISDEREQFGDLSTNIAFLIAKKAKQNPLEIAKNIHTVLLSIENISNIEIAGPGFLNIFLHENIYKAYYNLLSTNSKKHIISNSFSQEKYHIEFVSANPTGPLHIGHGRGAIIGDTLQRIFKKKGYQIESEYYINDAGIQIEKLGKSLYTEYALLNKCSIPPYEEGYKGEYITEIVNSLIKKYKNTLIDHPYGYFSDYGKNILLEKIKHTLSKYNVFFNQWFSEKILHDEKKIEEAIEVLDEKGFIYTTSDGALWFKATHFGDEKDRVLKKSDGAWTYTAADIAYFQNKISRGFTKIIMILGQDHHSFKTRMEAIAQALGYPKTVIHIILYQLITLKHNDQIVRMSKRKGNSIELEDIIDNIGVNVARFFYLYRKADAHLDLDIKEAKKINNENPVFYIQYAYVRIKSILEKYPHKKPHTNLNLISITSAEKLLLKKIDQLDETLEYIIAHYEPHLMAHYTTELAYLFHSFYNKEKIIDQRENDTAYRIGLLNILKDTFEICGQLLGITYPLHM